MKKYLRVISAFILTLTLPVLASLNVSAGWVQNRNKSWTYINSYNQQVTGWSKINSIWYYFDSNGIMQTGWKYISGKWYYFNRSGAMQTGWQIVNRKWYFFNKNGAMQTGWIKSDNAFYYLNSDGSMKTGWFYDKNWYYFSINGPMKTGWIKSQGDWYYMNPDGTMKTGWLELDKQQYYLLPSGKMAIGFHTINNILCYFNEKGVLSTDEITKKYDYEQKVLNIINQIRREENLRELVFSTSNSRGAGIRAEEITLKFDHIRPNGSYWYTIFTELKQSPDGTGENIARNYYTPEAVVDAWMNSYEHRKNILNPDFRYIGISYLEKYSGETYWVQLFSTIS